jgi:hypothetical protein
VITGDGAGRVAAVVGLLLIITGIFADGEICRRYSLLSATLGFYALVLALGSLFTPGGFGSTGSMLALLGAFLSIYGGMGYVR